MTVWHGIQINIRTYWKGQYDKMLRAVAYKGIKTKQELDFESDLELNGAFSIWGACSIFEELHAKRDKTTGHCKEARLKRKGRGKPSPFPPSDYTLLTVGGPLS